MLVHAETPVVRRHVVGRMVRKDGVMSGAIRGTLRMIGSSQRGAARAGSWNERPATAIIRLPLRQLSIVNAV